MSNKSIPVRNRIFQQQLKWHFVILFSWLAYREIAKILEGNYDGFLLWGSIIVACTIPVVIVVLLWLATRNVDPDVIDWHSMKPLKEEHQEEIQVNSLFSFLRNQLVIQFLVANMVILHLCQGFFLETPVGLSTLFNILCGILLLNLAMWRIKVLGGYLRETKVGQRNAQNPTTAKAE